MMEGMPSAPPSVAADEPRIHRGEEDASESFVERDEDPADGGGDGDEPNDDGRPDDGDEGPWETVATFWQPPQAHVARLRLEQGDIPCVLFDENLIATDWFLANAVGGIKLQVRVVDAERARELLALPSAPRPTCDEPLYDGQVLCPRCGSDRHHPERLSRRLMFLSILLLGAPLPIFVRHNRCEACGETWR
jgi:hypothetical protein